MNSFYKAHLILSAIVVFAAALVYGSNPSYAMPLIFDFEVTKLEHKNIFRALMGLYMAFAIFWLVGAFKSKYFFSATLSNVIFMAGLAFGRMLSTIFDGVSTPYTIGLVLELLVMAWGWLNLKWYSKNKKGFK